MTTDESPKDRLATLRQLAIDCLSNYRGGFAELEQIDRDLKSIIRTLSDIADPSWTKSLLRQWGQLEIIYALTLADGRLHLTQEEDKDVQDIVAGLINEFRDGYSSPR
jgi:hypothetical protein